MYLGEHICPKVPSFMYVILFHAFHTMHALKHVNARNVHINSLRLQDASGGIMDMDVDGPRVTAPGANDASTPNASIP